MQRYACTRYVLFALSVFALAVVAAQAMQAQTFTVIHDFTGGVDGRAPAAGLTMDRAGNLYGTTIAGGDLSCQGIGCGVVFRLANAGSGWHLTSLYAFGSRHSPDGIFPYARVVFGPNGALYGTNIMGGAGGSGTVFSLRPPPTPCKATLCPWSETILYSFSGGSDGGQPYAADLIFDRAGSIYGTTLVGGNQGGNCGFRGCGTVYTLTPSGGSWTENVLHAFTGSPDASSPWAGVIFDTAGNLYGTTLSGGQGLGTVFQLTPSGSGWTENIIHDLSQEGGSPYAGLIFDPSGNLYGASILEAFELTPSGGSWTFRLLAYLGGQFPYGSLTMDSTGSLYGTTQDATGRGSIFKLTLSGGVWTETVLHYFTGGSDGGVPYGSVVFDANGNLYGTASAGGAYNQGVVWEIGQ